MRCELRKKNNTHYPKNLINHVIARDQRAQPNQLIARFFFKTRAISTLHRTPNGACAAIATVKTGV